MDRDIYCRIALMLTSLDWKHRDDGAAILRFITSLEKLDLNDG